MKLFGDVRFSYQLRGVVFSFCIFLLSSGVNTQNATIKEEDTGFDKSTGAIPVIGNKTEAVAAVAVAAEVVAPEESSDPEKAIEQIKQNISLELAESTGKDWGDLSATILFAAWDNNEEKSEVSVLELMEWFDNVGGEERLHLLRILELMDKNMNGLISRDEFVTLYSGPMASPDKALELLHRVNDYDGNGFISVWETLTQVLTVDGINRNIYDKYRQAAYTNKIQDSNSDKSISLHEFTNYMVWQMNLGIAGYKGSAQ